MEHDLKTEPERLKVGEWTFHVNAHELVNGVDTIRLEPRVASLLLYLATRAGETVSRRALLQALWPNAIVGDEALTNAINKLRRAFDDDRASPRVIETIPKTGYRLIAPVEYQPTATGHTHAVSGAVRLPATGETVITGKPASIPVGRRRVCALGGILLMVLLTGFGLYLLPKILEHDSSQGETDYSAMRIKPSLAVIPLINMGDDPQQDYFIDGITEDLITDLSGISGLAVIARNAVFGYKGLAPTPAEIAEQLGASHMLEGSVRKEANRVRINVQLIDTATGYNLWAQRFDGTLDDVFDLQDQLARKIASALTIQLTDREKDILANNPTSNVEALKHFFLGRAYFGSVSKQENDLSRKMYLRAIELDPGYAKAYAALALTYLDDQRRGWSTDPAESIDRALKLAHQAISIDEAVPQAYFVLGFIYLYAKAQHDDAIAAAKRSIELDPNYADGYTLLSSAYFFSGYPEKSLALDRKAMQLNPTAGFLYYMHLGRSYFVQQRYEDAVEAFQQAVEHNINYIPNHLWLAASFAEMGIIDEAEWELEQVLTLDSGFSIYDWIESRPYKNPLYKKRLYNGLLKAGMAPHQPPTTQRRYLTDHKPSVVQECNR